MNPPNPNDSAYNRETQDSSWRFHERYRAQFGPEINPSFKPFRPLRISSVVTKNQDSFYTFAPAPSSDKST